MLCRINGHQIKRSITFSEIQNLIRISQSINSNKRWLLFTSIIKSNQFDKLINFSSQARWSMLTLDRIPSFNY
ncbi:Uncharacterised protein [Segatella copri]|nr:Uncharacterised protein [Segatella copri]